MFTTEKAYRMVVTLRWMSTAKNPVSFCSCQPGKAQGCEFWDVSLLSIVVQSGYFAHYYYYIGTIQFVSLNIASRT